MIDFKQARADKIINEELFPLLQNIIPNLDLDHNPELRGTLEENLALIRRVLLAMINTWNLDKNKRKFLTTNLSGYYQPNIKDISILLEETVKTIDSIIHEPLETAILQGLMVDDILKKIEAGITSKELLLHLEKEYSENNKNDTANILSFRALKDEKTKIKNALRDTDIKEKLDWLIPTIIERIIQKNNLQYTDIIINESEIIVQAIKCIQAVPNTIFETDDPLINSKIDFIKQLYLAEYLQDYDIVLGEYRPKFPLVPKNNPDILMIEAFTQCIVRSQEEFQIDEDILKQDISERIQEIQALYHSRVPEYITGPQILEVLNISDETEKLEAIIDILFTYCVLYTNREDGRYEYIEDIEYDFENIFLDFITENIHKLGYENNLNAYRVLKNYDYEQKFEAIKDKYYDKNAKKL